ncbi:hypothetical protein NDU88_001771 [Pleurodeles waltl]|uniref:Uncharacterized protein n=1 Tax=Pleurodeles waltl TaxID=8319 RepID=A0AAV7T1G2_PLEWA|nr:hypothetical protein NDU88_001771 [Pleurodeles waltl]
MKQLESGRCGDPSDRIVRRPGAREFFLWARIGEKRIRGEAQDVGRHLAFENGVRIEWSARAARTAHSAGSPVHPQSPAPEPTPGAVKPAEQLSLWRGPDSAGPAALRSAMLASDHPRQRGEGNRSTGDLFKRLGTKLARPVTRGPWKTGPGDPQPENRQPPGTSEESIE